MYSRPLLFSFIIIIFLIMDTFQFKYEDTKITLVWNYFY